jgi:predicted PurR-regulated permease PerM
MQAISRADKVSFAFMGVLLVMLGVLHMAIPFLAVLFSYFALDKLRFGSQGKVLPVILFAILVAGIGAGLYYFIVQAVHTLPQVAEKSIPVMVGFAQKYSIELPFKDYAELKTLVFESVTEPGQRQVVGRFGTGLGRQLVFLVFALVISVSVFLNARYDLDEDQHRQRDNLYTASADAIALRLRNLYDSFATVMGAQIKISGINTALTAVFVIWAQLPYSGLIIVATFLCGLLPIIGNVISNTIITGIGFTKSPQLGVAALAFLVGLHKLEYFLNSKIIGERIRNPMWLTLLGLIIGERLMGIPGMILAPVVLYYIKSEAARLRFGATPGTPAQPPEFVTVSRNHDAA